MPCLLPFKRHIMSNLEHIQITIVLHQRTLVTCYVWINEYPGYSTRIYAKVLTERWFYFTIYASNLLEGKQNKHTQWSKESQMTTKIKIKSENTGVPVKLPALYCQPPLWLIQYVGTPSKWACKTTKAKWSLGQLFLSERPVNLWSWCQIET